MFGASLAKKSSPSQFADHTTVIFPDTTKVYFYVGPLHESTGLKSSN